MARTRDICDEVAAILMPDRDKTDGPDAEEHKAHRDRLAQHLRLAWEEEGEDPLLAGVRSARLRKLQAEQEIRNLITYAREFIGPKPYKLVELAEAAGLSISGVRIAYEQDDIAQVAEAINRPIGIQRPVRTQK